MTKKKNDTGAETSEEISFEKALDRLEAIVGEMEGGGLSLEDMMRRFEEGQKLAALCSGKLNEIERKIEILVKHGEGVRAEPFEPLEAEAKADDDGEDVKF